MLFVIHSISTSMALQPTISIHVELFFRLKQVSDLNYHKRHVVYRFSSTICQMFETRSTNGGERSLHFW